MAKLYRAPPPLSRGAVVRLIRPAGAYDEGRLQQGMLWLEAQGLKPRLGSPMNGPERASAYYAGDLQARTADVQAALDCPEACALWAVRGGSGTAQLVPQLQAHVAARLARAPLWLVGFSDITTLHGLWQSCGSMSLHGANAVSVPQWTPEAQNELLGHLGLQGSFGPRPAQFACAPVCGPTAAAADAAGPIVGGNLTVLASLCGTGALPRWRGCVVFLEDIDERPYRLDRALNQLVAAGAFAGVQAVVFGQLTRCDALTPEGHGHTALQLMAPTLQALGVPVVSGVAVGHEPSSRPLLLGARAHLQQQGTLLEVAP